MRSSFAARRKARKVGQDEEENDNSDTPMSGDQGEASDTPTVIRPPISSRGSSKTKKRTSLRTSFGPGGTSMTEDDDGDRNSAVFTPRKSTLSRQAVEKNALRKSLAPSLPKLRQNEDRPSYSASHLAELKTSTPSTPKEVAPVNPSQSKELDLAAKFGTDLALHHSRPSNAIPTDTEIQEKKRRRARLAKEREFISLSASDNDNDIPSANASSASETESDTDNPPSSSLLPYQPPHKKPPSRLARTGYDDEDDLVADFHPSGPLNLGRKQEREARRRRKVDIAKLINEAEGSGGSGSDEDASEEERRAAYEAAQTRKGMDGLGLGGGEVEVRRKRPAVPGRITPVSSLGGVLERLREERGRRGVVRREMGERLGGVRGELADVEVRRGVVRRLMGEAGARFELLRGRIEEEAGKGKVEGEGKGEGGLVVEEEVVEGKEEVEEAEEEEEEEEEEERMGLGMRAGLGMGMGMGMGGGGLLESLGKG